MITQGHTFHQIFYVEINLAVLQIEQKGIEGLASYVSDIER